MSAEVQLFFHMKVPFFSTLHVQGFAQDQTYGHNSLRKSNIVKIFLLDMLYAYIFNYTIDSVITTNRVSGMEHINGCDACLELKKHEIVK